MQLATHLLALVKSLLPPSSLNDLNLIITAGSIDNNYNQKLLNIMNAFFLYI